MVEVGLVVEDQARVDRPVEDVGEQFGDVDAGGAGPASPADVAEEGALEGDLAVGYAHDADRRARPGDGEGGGDRLGGAHALEGGVDADAAGELQTARGRVASLFDDVGGAELPGQLLAGGVSAEGDDPLGAEPLGGEDGGKSDRTVADDGDRVALVTPALTAAWWPVHITSDRASRERRVSSEWPWRRDRDQRAAGQRDAHGFALAAVDLAVAEEPPWRQLMVEPVWQLGQVMSLKMNGAITRSPTRPVTSAPSPRRRR